MEIEADELELLRRSADAATKAERERCAKIVDPQTGPLAWRTCNASACLMAAENFIVKGLNPDEFTKGGKS